MTLEILKDLRKLKVLVVHPNNEQGSEICQHIERIGCKVRMVWPCPKHIKLTTDVVFLQTLEDHPFVEKPAWLADEKNSPTIIAIVDYENPTVLQTAYELGAHAILNTPVRPFGLLANLVIGRAHWRRELILGSRVKKLETKIRNIHAVEHAIAILERANSISREQAYEFIRSKAMERRLTTEDVAQEIVSADKTLEVSIE
ncbi:MAG: ANTAR domain-containing protein [Gammaproteobacteria bacterium]